MSCLGCQRIETEPQSLHDGVIVCSVCPDWMAECEARELLSLGEIRGKARLAQLRAHPVARNRVDNLKALMIAIQRGKEKSHA